jgi:hypothetical protein
MQGMTLLVTYVVMALVSVVIAATIGIVLDNLPHIHDMFSVLGFFGALAILLPAAWLVSVRLTEPREQTQGYRRAP